MAHRLALLWHRHSCVCFLLSPIFFPPASAEIIDRMAVAVGSRAITTSDIDRETRITAFLNGTAPDFSMAGKQATADRLVEQKLIQQELENSNYQFPDAGDIEPVLEKFKKDHYASESQYHSALGTYGITEQDVKGALLWQRAVLLFINARFRPSVEVGDKEVEEYLQKEVAAARAAHPGQTVDLEELRSRVEEAIAAQRVDEAMNKWLEEVRRRTRVLIRMEVFR